MGDAAQAHKNFGCEFSQRAMLVKHLLRDICLYQISFKKYMLKCE